MNSKQKMTDDTGDLHIPEFAHGYLLCYSLYHATDVRESGEDDGGEQVVDVPLTAGEHCEYKTYDLNFCIDDEDDDKMYCTAYEVWFDEAGQAYTKTDEWTRLW